MAASVSVPRRIKVIDLVSSRYPAGSKPLSWDERFAGVDIVKDEKGGEVKLFCEGDQSSPGEGWEILLTREKEPSVYEWTLYGISRVAGK